MKRKINKILRMIRNSFIEFLQRPVVVNASLSIDKTGEVYHSNWAITYHEILLIDTKQFALFVTVVRIEKQRQVLTDIILVK